jgi:hypothetical protein
MAGHEADLVDANKGRPCSRLRRIRKLGSAYISRGSNANATLSQVLPAGFLSALPVPVVLPVISPVFLPLVLIIRNKKGPHDQAAFSSLTPA